MQDQDSFSVQGFDSQPAHNPNWSISTIISTSCIILDESQDPSFNLGCTQGEVAGAVATTSVRTKGSEISNRKISQLSHCQPAEDNSLYPMNSRPIEYPNLDISNQADGYNYHLYEPEIDVFNWTNQATSTSCSNREGHVGLSSEEEFYGSKSNYGDRDRANCLYLERKTKEKSTEIVQGNNDCDFNSRPFFNSSSGLKRYDQVIDFPLEDETCNEFPINAKYDHVSPKDFTFDELDISASNRPHEFQTNRSCLQKNSNVDQRGFRSDSWPSKSFNTYPASRTEKFSTCCSADKTNREHYPDIPSYHCSLNKIAEEQNVMYNHDSRNYQSSLNSAELIPGNIEMERYEGGFQEDISNFQADDTFYGQCHNSKTFLGCSTPQVYKNNQITNSDDEYVPGSTIFGQPGYPTPSLDRVHTNDFRSEETYIQQGHVDRTDKMVDTTCSNSSKSGKSSCVAQMDKKNKDTAESLQRQLLILEERRKDAAEDVRQNVHEYSQSYDVSKPNSQDRVLVDVDHMICSGVTVAGFKPRATIRKRNKVAMCSDDKDRGYWQKRRKNNDSARKSREAKKEKEKGFYKRALELEYENMYLQRCLQMAESKLAALGQTLVLPPLNNQGYF